MVQLPDGAIVPLDAGRDLADASQKPLPGLVDGGPSGPPIAPGQSPDPATIASATGISQGLVVHLGTTDGAFELALAGTGKVVVHGLAFSDAAVDAARAAIDAKGLYGLASVQRAESLARLPYADDEVNLLVADIDAMASGAPSGPEVLRVLAPKGVAYLRSGGSWTATPKARPNEIDDWPHFDYDSMGNGVSQDQRVAPPKQVQFVTGIQQMQLGGNPAQYYGSSGLRIADGRMYGEMVIGTIWEDPWGDGPRDRIGAWDAWNGIPLWGIGEDTYGRKSYHSVAAGDRYYAVRKTDGAMVSLDCIDGATGNVVRNYNNVIGAFPENYLFVSLRFANGRLYVANGPKLFAINADTGAKIWQYAPSGVSAFFGLSVDDSAGRVYAALSSAASDYKDPGRWPAIPASAVVALDLSTGSEVWRNTSVSGHPIGQILPNGDKVAVFGGTGIGAPTDNAMYANLSASNGQTLWTHALNGPNEDWALSMFVRNGSLFYSEPWNLHRVDPATGNQSIVYGGGFNNRCERVAATSNYILHGIVSYIDASFKATFSAIARSSCSNSTFPANGMMYYTPQACGCVTSLRGFVALTPEELPPAVADADRLEGGHAAGSVGTAKPPAAPANLIVEHWTKYLGAAPLEKTVTLDGQIFAILPQRHRLEARDASGRAKWAFTADGRISTPPVALDGILYFGSSDGHIYAVREADGALVFRFLAARAERLIVAHGQVESSWPVLGVVLHQNKIFGTAGYHPELGGGILVWGLEPATGKVLVKRVLSKSPTTVASSADQSKIAAHSCLNGPLASDGTNLILPGDFVGSTAGSFKFDPNQTDAQLKALLETPK